MGGSLCRRCCVRRPQEASAKTSQQETFMSKDFISHVAMPSDSFVSIECGAEDEAARREALCDELGRVAAERLRCAELRIAGEPSIGSDVPWRDCTTPGSADCWVRTIRGIPKPVTTAITKLDSKLQRPEGLSLLETDGLSAKGALLTMMEFEHYKEWFPFCEASDVLMRWGQTDRLVHMQMKIPIVGLRLQAIIYVSLLDRLEEEGCLEWRVTSVGSSISRSLFDLEEGEPQEFLGVKLPKTSSRWVITAEVELMNIKIFPTGSSGRDQWYCAVVESEEKIPIDSAINVVWRTLSRNLLGNLAKRSGETEWKQLSPERIEFYRSLVQRLEEASARAEAKEPEEQVAPETA